MKYDVSDKMFKIRQNLKRKCKLCGHTQMVVNKDRVICSHCGHYIYKNDKIEFMYKVKEAMKCKK